MNNVNDRSYGIVPVRRLSEEWQFLIVKHLGGHWAFPKGHPEASESPKEAASRELQEETSLHIKQYFRRYPFNEQYIFFHAGNRITKTVIYYLAEVEGDLKAQEEELLDAKWCSFEECCEQLTYPRSVQICQQSYEFLSAKPGRSAGSSPTHRGASSSHRGARNTYPGDPTQQEFRHEP